MSARWPGAIIIGVLLLVGLVGLLDDLIRVAIWEVLAAAALLIWYGPARRLWRRTTRE